MFIRDLSTHGSVDGHWPEESLITREQIVMTRDFTFGIVGCGVIAPTHAGAIQQIEGARVVAAADIDHERAAEFARKFDIEAAYNSVEDLLKGCNCDAVCVCTPSGLHAEVALKAMLAGKHVVIEKPMDVSTEACDLLIKTAKETGCKLTVISQHRFDLGTRVAKQAIDSGKLGRIVLADASVRWYRTQEYYDSGDWRGTWALDGGGALMNQGVHTVDLLQWLAGDVQSLTAHTSTATHERIETEDIAIALLKFTNGALGSITATTSAYPGFPVRIDVYGTEGSLVLEGDRLREMRLKSGEVYEGERAAAHALSVAQGGTKSVEEEAVHAAGAAADPGALWGDSHRDQIIDFIDAVTNDHAPQIDGTAARKPVAIIKAVYRSAKTGTSVIVD